MKKKVDQELLVYLHKRIPMDVSREEIVQELKEAGWEDQDLFKGFEAYDAGVQPKSTTMLIMGTLFKNSLRILIAISAAFLITLFIEGDGGGHRSTDANIKANLNNIRAQAELVYDEAPGNYNAVCGINGVEQNQTIAHMIASAKQTHDDVEVVCGAPKIGDASAYAISASLRQESRYYCIDSLGTAHETERELGVYETICPSKVIVQPVSQ